MRKERARIFVKSVKKRVREKMKKFIILATILLLITFSFYTNKTNKTGNVDLVIIDSGISRAVEIPENVIIKYYNYNDNNNNHADLVLKTFLENVDDIGDNQLTIHDITVTNSNSVSVESLYNALVIAKDVNPDVINLSLGVNLDDKNIRSIIEELTKNGVIIIASACNRFGMSAQYPARYNTVISVGSLDKKGDISTFSARKYVDEYRLGEYDKYSGTSFSAPIVTAEIINDYFSN